MSKPRYIATPKPAGHRYASVNAMPNGPTYARKLIAKYGVPNA